MTFKELHKAELSGGIANTVGKMALRTKTCFLNVTVSKLSNYELSAPPKQSVRRDFQFTMRKNF